MGISSIINFLSPSLENYWGGGGAGPPGPSPGYGTAEILWVLHTITNHNSYNSIEQIDKLFARMFSDSDIAKGFSCGEKKTAYVCCFGLAPYFRSQLFEMAVGPFVFLSDENLCQTTQSK